MNNKKSSSQIVPERHVKLQRDPNHQRQPNHQHNPSLKQHPAAQTEPFAAGAAGRPRHCPTVGSKGTARSLAPGSNGHAQDAEGTATRRAGARLVDPVNPQQQAAC